VAMVKVYMPMGGCEYDGYDELSMRTFTTRKSAEDWVRSLTTDGYNRGEVFEQEVEK